MTDWDEWNNYAAKKKQQFDFHQMKWPGTPIVNGWPSQIVCCAILEQSRGK